MEGYNILDSADGSEPIGDLNIGGSTPAAVDQFVGGKVIEEGAGEIQVEAIKGIWVESAKDIDFNPFSSSTESNVNLPINEENLVNVPSNDN